MCLKIVLILVYNPFKVTVLISESCQIPAVIQCPKISKYVVRHFGPKNCRANGQSCVFYFVSEDMPQTPDSHAVVTALRVRPATKFRGRQPRTQSLRRLTSSRDLDLDRRHVQARRAVRRILPSLKLCHGHLGKMSRAMSCNKGRQFQDNHPNLKKTVSQVLAYILAART